MVTYDSFIHILIKPRSLCEWVYPLQSHPNIRSLDFTYLARQAWWQTRIQASLSLEWNPHHGCAGTCLYQGTMVCQHLTDGFCQFWRCLAVKWNSKFLSPFLTDSNEQVIRIQSLVINNTISSDQHQINQKKQNFDVDLRFICNSGEMKHLYSRPLIFFLTVSTSDLHLSLKIIIMTEVLAVDLMLAFLTNQIIMSINQLSILTQKKAQAHQVINSLQKGSISIMILGMANPVEYRSISLYK